MITKDCRAVVKQFVRTFIQNNYIYRCLHLQRYERGSFIENPEIMVEKSIGCILDLYTLPRDSFRRLIKLNRQIYLFEDWSNKMIIECMFDYKKTFHFN